jgi:ribosomal protein S18 acetylase RimI-like enzyme
VIGRRIVVRRLLRGETGPSGGPAMTDLLGVCESWTAEACVVRPESGDPVTIPLADIVSGKPVPPRPSVRMRVSARDAESHTAALVGSDVEPLGEWQLRWEPAPEGRVRKRANSCLAMGEPDRPLAEAVDAVTAFYTDRDRVPLVQVERDGDLEAAITALGWAPVPGDADLLLTSAAMLRRALAGVEAAPALVTEEGRIGVGVDGDWLGIHDLYVAPAHRRRGVATRLLAAALEWGAEQGARTVWLHVETDNTPALAFYDGLGFAAHHGCRYLTLNPR